MEDTLKKALNYVYLLLKYRPRARKELIQRLKKRNYSPSIIEKVLGRLERSGILNDNLFALSYARDKIRHKFGEKKIVSDLKRLGVDEEVIREVLERAKKELDYSRVLKELISRLYLKYRDKDNPRRKIIRYLIQRGFNFEEIVEEIERFGFADSLDRL